MNRGRGRGRSRFNHKKRWDFNRQNYGNACLGRGSSNEGSLFGDRDAECSRFSTDKSDGPFKGWALYFNETYSEFHPAVKLIKSFEKFLKVRLSSYIQSDFEKQESFIVDVQELVSDEDLNEECLDLLEKIISDPELVIKSLSLTMHQILSNKLDDTDVEMSSDGEEAVDERTALPGMDWLEPASVGLISARLVKLDKHTPLKSLKANYFGKLVSVRGTVVRVSNIRPLCVKMAFTCTTCNQMQCFSDECRGRVFVPERSSGKTETVNWQTIKILEISDDREEARVPRSVECELSCDLVGSCAPGDVVTLVGIVKVNSTSDGHARYQEDKCMFSLYIEVNSVLNNSRNVRCNDQRDVPTSVATSKLGVEFTERDLEFVREMHSQPNLYRLIVHSLCPAIYGHELVKAGLILGLFGGTRKFANEKDRIPVRGDPHVLVVGDPGLGKSQMLQACANVSPRGVYICGHNTTTAGLTVTLSREGASAGGCENMEAGALVLSDQGCCCIDEFDKMGQQQQQALLEAMEQQNVSVAKAGVLCNLTARTSILAAANPVGGHYNRAKTVSENLKLGSALLSRFDLVFILVDKPNEEVDAMLSEHVIAQRSKSSSSKSLQSYSSSVIEEKSRSSETLRERLKLNLGEPPLDVVPHELFRKYIAYGRTYVHPRLTPAAANVLQQFYLEMRLRAQGDGANSTPITLRQLESLIRLSEARARLELREEVSVEDAKDVIEILNYSMMDTFSDDLGNVNFERSQHGSGMSKQSLAKKFIAVLNNTAERTSNSFFTMQQMRQIAKMNVPGASGHQKKKKLPKGAFGDRMAAKSSKSKRTRSEVSLDPEEYSVRKRIPAKWPKRDIDIYVTRKTHFAAQLSRCQKLLDSGERDVFVHGLGAAVTRALHLALQLKRKHEGSVELDINTSTVSLVDDLLPEKDHLYPTTRARANSAVHIRIFRPDIPAAVST